MVDTNKAAISLDKILTDIQLDVERMRKVGLAEASRELKKARAKLAQCDDEEVKKMYCLPNVKYWEEARHAFLKSTRDKRK